MKVSEVLNDQDMKIFGNHRNEFEYLDELLINHALALDVQEYALLRCAQELSYIRRSTDTIIDQI